MVCVSLGLLEATLAFFEVILDHYKVKGKKARDLRPKVFELLEERHLRWGRAI